MDRPEPLARQTELLFKIRVGFVTLVALSAALIAVYADGSLLDVGLAIGGGVAAGLVLAWLVFPSSDGRRSERSRSRR